MIAAPVRAQYIYMDVDGDEKCTSADFPPYEEGTIDVWLDTSQDQYGEPVVCPTGEEMTLSSYELALGLTNFTVTGWTNSRPEFSQSLGLLTEGNFVYLGYTSGGSAQLPPGRYKLGTMSLSSTGGCGKVVQIMSAAQVSGTLYHTQFYSQCMGLDGDYSENLGQDFFDVCSLGAVCHSADDPTSTTWGRIKQIYLDR